MTSTYKNNDVEITVEQIDAYECKVNINGKNLIWISKLDQQKFAKELKELLDKYRI